MSVIAANRTLTFLSILALLGLGCARVTPTDSEVDDANNRTSGVTPPACGRVTPRQTPLGTNGDGPDVRDFPWHANLYAAGYGLGGKKKEYRCGATIIQANLLVTAARCVAWGIQLLSDPKELFVMTGNVHRDWDSPHNTAAYVRKSAVKNAYVHCQHYGTLAGVANDIALIELEEPLPLSETLTPACLDVAGYRKQLLVPGAYGKLAEFGGYGSNDILQTSTLPYVSHKECRLAGRGEQHLQMMLKDKFCTGYANGGVFAPLFGVGGGLVFEKDGAWYLMGIHSTTLFNFDDSDDRDLDEKSYKSAYTKISYFTEWIQQVISLLQRNESVPNCNPERVTSLKEIDDYRLDRDSRHSVPPNYKG